MKIVNTLNWSQKQAAEDSVRINVTKVVQDDAGNVVSTTGEDQTVTTPDVVDAAKQLEAAIVAAGLAQLPAAE